MPIRLPDDLPAARTLEAEGLRVLRQDAPLPGGSRPLRIGLLNLMPDKAGTETQLARMLAAAPFTVALTLVRMSDHSPRNAAADHMNRFYRPWSELRGERFDGFIVTGAPVERLAFAAVRYWDELRRILDWTQSHVGRTLTICWGGQAALHHFHGMPKHELAAKAFGVFRHRVLTPASPYLSGLPRDFGIPVSRWTEVRAADLPAGSGMVPLLASEETGLCLLDDPRHRTLHIFNHLEYDAGTLAAEYFRDLAAGAEIRVPAGYFPQNDPSQPPANTWHGNGRLFYGNWLRATSEAALEARVA